MIMNLLGWLLFGLIIGALARLLVPGRDPMGWLGTIAVGVVGSFLGGFVASLLTGEGLENFSPAGVLGSLIGAIVVVLIVRKMSSPRRLT